MSRIVEGIVRIFCITGVIILSFLLYQKWHRLETEQAQFEQLSASVKEIKSSAFNTSRNLKTLIYLGTSPNDINYQSDSFLYCDNLTILILPNVPNPDYNTWKNFLGRNFTEVKQQ